MTGYMCMETQNMVNDIKRETSRSWCWGGKKHSWNLSYKSLLVSLILVNETCRHWFRDINSQTYINHSSIVSDHIPVLWPQSCHCGFETEYTHPTSILIHINRGILNGCCFEWRLDGRGLVVRHLNVCTLWQESLIASGHSLVIRKTGFTVTHWSWLSMYEKIPTPIWRKFQGATFFPAMYVQMCVAIQMSCNRAHANPVYCVATICHQVRWLRWGTECLSYSRVYFNLI